jgi:hypothetical protein
MSASAVNNPRPHKSPVAAEALERIEALYAIEKEIRGRLPEEWPSDPE